MKRASILVASFLILTACGDIPVSQQTTTTTQPKNASGLTRETLSPAASGGGDRQPRYRASRRSLPTTPAASPVTSPHQVCESFSGWTYLAEECRP